MKSTFQYDPVLLGEVPCPIEGCDVDIPISARLVIEEDYDDGPLAKFNVGTLTDTSSIELHMIEHGMNPNDQEAGE